MNFDSILIAAADAAHGDHAEHLPFPEWAKVFTTFAGVALLVLMLPALWRIIVGPTAIDRVLAVNVVGTKTAVLLVIIGIMFDRVGMFVDFALAYGLLNFIGSVAASRYLHKTEPMAGMAEPIKPVTEEGAK